MCLSFGCLVVLRACRLCVRSLVCLFVCKCKGCVCVVCVGWLVGCLFACSIGEVLGPFCLLACPSDVEFVSCVCPLLDCSLACVFERLDVCLFARSSLRLFGCLILWLFGLMCVSVRWFVVCLHAWLVSVCLLACLIE